MYSSTGDLRAGLHRVLAALAIAEGWNEEQPWWAALSQGHKARTGGLGLEDLESALRTRSALLEALFVQLGLEPPARDSLAASFRRAIISGKAHVDHGGRDVYGASNKALWDLLVQPLATALEERWGVAALARGVGNADEREDLFALRHLLGHCLSFRTGPSDSGHDGCVVWLQECLERLGFTVVIHRSADGDPPVVEATRASLGKAGHVVMYGHYDTVGPFDGWRSPPHELTESEGRWFGRGISDNKGPLCARLWALASIGDAPALTWLIQGQEETGSHLARTVFERRMPREGVDLYLDETGYHDHEGGTLRLLARELGCALSSEFKIWLQGLRLLAARRGYATRLEERGLNKSLVDGGCPFDALIPSGARCLALGVNDSASGIHAANESLPLDYFALHREQLKLLFHCVGVSEGQSR